MTPQVRLAEPSDADVCQQLEAQCHGAASGTRGADAFFGQYPVAFRTSNGFTLVAEVDGVIVGFVTVLVENAASQTTATIERIFVAASARRVGIGDALIGAVRSAARERKCSRLDALALPGDRDTKNLYERNGLTARLITASSQL